MHSHGTRRKTIRDEGEDAKRLEGVLIIHTQRNKIMFTGGLLLGLLDGLYRSVTVYRIIRLI